MSSDQNNRGLETIPFRVVNQTGLDAPLYLWVQGIVPDTTPNEYVYLQDLSGDVTDTPKGSSSATFSMLLPDQETQAVLPRLIALRVYLSFGEQLFTTTTADGIPVSPSGWSPGDPVQGGNYTKLWDFFELTWTRDNDTTTTLGANLSQLDFFALSLQLDNYGYQGNLTTPEHLQSGFAGNARRIIVDKIKGLGEPWSSLVLADLNPAFPGVPLRVLSPYHGMELGLFPTDQLQGYIDRVWSYYTTKTLRVTVGGREYTGRVHSDGPDDGLFVFEPPDGSGLQPVKIRQPNTNTRAGFVSGSKDVYECQLQLDLVPLDPVSTDATDIARDLGAGFLRSTLAVGAIDGVDLDVLPACDQVDHFHKHEPIDMYAAVMHENAIEHKAYAFGYDDLCERSSVGITKNPTELVLTIHPVAT
jgi:hypothetical protein